jgi:MoxR-like ATPase
MGDSITTLLVALFGGVAASLVAGYFARPKTKGEAAQANANANVALSAEAREWANVFIRKADEADARAKHAEDRAEEANARAEEASERADEAEDRVTDLDNKLTAAVVYMRTLRNALQSMEHPVPDPPHILRGMWDEGDRFQ